MSLTYGLSTVRDLFEKLKRDSTSLDDEVNSDRMFNFVVTVYSMIDWIKNDPSVPQSAKCDSEVQGLYNDRWLKVCGDLATASKHFSLTKRRPITSSVTSSQGYGIGRYGKGGYGIGEEAIEINLSDGRTYDALELVEKVLDKWQCFFNKHGIER